ncbi:MAG: hypothetical protein FWG79_08415 [Bacteroidales bacterium]|nr:hypothetical protein [Bacteroidales bacterium]
MKYADTKKVAAAKGNSAGRNHEVGRKIVECSRHYGLNTVEQVPFKKYWKGKDGKITHEEITKFIPGLPKTTNQEERNVDVYSERISPTSIWNAKQPKIEEL